MSRAFNGGTSADCITFAPGSAPVDQGPITIAVLAKASSVAGFTMWAIAGRKTGTRVWSMLTSNNAGPKLFMENDFSNGVSGLSTSWRWYVVTKASGSATPRWHVWDLAGSWTHGNTDNTVPDNTGAIDEILIGLDNSSTTWRGSIAAAAAWGSVLNDAGVEAACTNAALDLLGASPDWAVLLNQASTATSVPDITGNGGDQTALSGTTVDADDPDFDYSLAATITPDGVAVTAGVGAPSVSQSLTVTPSGVAVTAGVGTPSASQSMSVTPSGVAVSTTLGQPTLTWTGAITPSGIAVTTTLGTPALDQTIEPGFDVGPDGIAITATLGTPTLTFAMERGSWESLRGIVREARADHERNLERIRNPIDCPEHGWPLERTSRGLHCQFGGHVVR